MNAFSRYGAARPTPPPRLSDAEFRRLMDEAKDRRNLSDVIGRHTNLKPRGRLEMVGLCPFHPERSPSFEVNDSKGTYHCHGCGEGGDAFTFLRKKDGLSFREAYEALSGDTFPEVTEADRVKRKAEADRVTRNRIMAGRKVWDRARPAFGTLAETYLRSRSIVSTLPDTVRFAHLDYWDQETGEVVVENVPAAVCALQDAGGKVVGVQRIYLAADGLRKLAVPKPKLSLGVIVGSAFRASGTRFFSDALEDGPTTHLIVCEGPEDGLTLAQELPGKEVWVACGTAMMSRLHLPSSVRSVVLAGDNNAAGRDAVVAAAAALSINGVDVSAMYPDPAFPDWNDALRGIAK